MSDPNDRNQAPGNPTSRRDFLAKATGAALATALPAAGQAAPQPKSAATQSRRRRLNVLFFMSDDMRPELASYNSRFNAHSPNIDALAPGEFASTATTASSRSAIHRASSLFTGHPPRTTKVLGNSTSVRDLHPDWITLPQLFREHGYTTLRSGKLFHAGLDDHKAGPTSTATSSPCTRRRLGKPMNIPHAPSPHARRRAARAPRRQRTRRTLRPDHRPRRQRRRRWRLHGCRPRHSVPSPVAPIRTSLSSSAAASPNPTARPRRRSASSICTTPRRSSFRRTSLRGPPSLRVFQRPPSVCVTPISSSAVARLSPKQSKSSAPISRRSPGPTGTSVASSPNSTVSELRDNTVVVFVADHGYQLGEKGKWSKAGSLFENGTRVPLIIHMPGAHGNGRSCTRIVQSLDIYRTLCAALPVSKCPPALRAPASCLCSTTRAPHGTSPPSASGARTAKRSHGTAVRTEQWRYAEYGPNASNGAMLFDVHADPMELTNLADEPQHQQTRAQLAKLIAAYTPADPAG